jgi:ARG/rhodanese/phosphatase superfamily protein
MRFAWTAAGIAAGLVLGVAIGLSTEQVSPPLGATDGVHLDAHRSLAAPVVVGNLTVWPVVTDQAAYVGEFLSLDEAQKRGVVEVREVGAATAAADATERNAQVAATEAPEVNRLVVDNQGELPLLLCAGTLLCGGNQDRQLGEDVVVAPHTAEPVEVYCVEQGRWSAQREGVETTEFTAAGSIAPKAVRESAQYVKSQEAVWDNVERLCAADGDIAEATAGGRTTALRVLENASAETQKRRDETAATVRAAFDALAGRPTPVVGFAYAVNGRPVSVRTFADARLCRGHLDAFVRAMVLDAEAAAPDAPTAAAKAEDVVALVRDIDAATDRKLANRAIHVLVTRKADAGFNSCLFGTAAPRTPLTEDWTAK